MENNNSSNNKIAHPILGIPQKAGDSYVVKDHAIVGLVYTLVCPKCHKHLLIKASSAKLNVKIAVRPSTIKDKKIRVDRYQLSALRLIKMRRKSTITLKHKSQAKKMS